MKGDMICMVEEASVRERATMDGNKVAVYSFFSCAGFLDLGFERANGNPYELRMANEIDPNFRECYRYSRAHLNLKIDVPPNFMFPNSIVEFVKWGGHPRKGCEEVYRCFSDLLKEDRRRHRVIGFIGGPPCPDFSVAGKNAGKNGEVGPLSSKYVRLICQEEPHFFLFENVKGLVSSEKHSGYFKSLCVKLSEKYYLTHDVVNALWYGVPQFRERLIVVGIRRDLLPDFTHRRLRTEMRWADFQWLKAAVLAQGQNWPHVQDYNPDPAMPRPKGVGIAALTVHDWWIKNDVQHHPNQVNQTMPRVETRHKFEEIREGNMVGKSYHRLHRWKYAFTACYGHNEVPLHPWEARRISVAEALATQSLPPDFSLPPDMGISALFKAVGNGVPFLMAQGLANMIQSFLIRYGISEIVRKKINDEYHISMALPGYS